VGVYAMFFSNNNVVYENKQEDVVQSQDVADELKDETVADDMEDVSSVDPACVGGEFVDEYDMCGEEIGRSVEDRPIYSFSVGGGENTVLVVGGIHTGAEYNSFDVVSKLLKHYAGVKEGVLEDVQLVFVPVVNPDGIANNTRTNAHDVDLNRNWSTDDWKTDTYHPDRGTSEGAGGDKPLSEPETTALNGFIADIDPSVAIIFYSQAGVVEDNDVGIAHSVAALYADAADYTHIDEWTYYEITGDLLASLREDGIPAFEVVLETRETELDRNLKGLQEVLNYFE
ncbi:MAG: DUF2817 domain-containing protein, partial [Candidatus Pacebacteria bacterium]|nr:DUF2817 domain-containing protein [Candidatus Paceibacterota bacterium]